MNFASKSHRKKAEGADRVGKRRRQRKRESRKEKRISEENRVGAEEIRSEGKPEKEKIFFGKRHELI